VLAYMSVAAHIMVLIPKDSGNVRLLLMIGGLFK